MEITTPGLLFPAISLLMLAYTNRFLGLANLMRQLISKFQDQKKESDWKQIENLRFRISLLRYIQALGVLSLLLCTSSIFSIFLGTDFLSRILFGFAIILMAISLCLSLWEIHLSVVSLDIEIANIRNKESE
jgi:amino acid transporter